MKENEDLKRKIVELEAKNEKLHEEKKEIHHLYLESIIDNKQLRIKLGIKEQE